MRNFKNIVGQVFGRLTVIRREEKRNENWYWLCRCECGKYTVVQHGALKNGNTKSCGCYQKDKATTHGMYKTRIYRIWHAMKARCDNHHNCAYRDYGGRGIDVCDRWKESFENFRDDMLDSYNKHAEEFGVKQTTLDRINHDGNYEPSNCRWADMKEQGNNRRNNMLINYKGRDMRLADISTSADIRYTTLYDRIITYGWSIDKATTTPVRHIKKKEGIK